MSSISEVYHERDQVIAALSKIFESHLCLHDMNYPGFEYEFRYVVCIHLPTGDVAWHIHEDEAPLFSHLEMKQNHYDGFSDEEKYRRLNSLEEQ